jgi:hypothetical protein
VTGGIRTAQKAASALVTVPDLETTVPLEEEEEEEVEEVLVARSLSYLLATWVLRQDIQLKDNHDVEKFKLHWIIPHTVRPDLREKVGEKYWMSLEKYRNCVRHTRH